MRERAIRFGKSTSLIGVMTEPSQGVDRSPVGVIFLNSGILHHVGACRMHVRLARQLADQGFTSIRFDLSGIGDSEARKDSLTFEQSAQLEVQEAMDYLTASKRVSEFALIGLCSGADMAFAVSQLDTRVVGLVQLDAFVYRTPGYYVHHYAPRLLKPAVWTNFIKKAFGLRPPAGAHFPTPGEDYVRSEYRRKFPPKETVEAGLRKLVARSVDLLFLFSGGQPQHFNHRAQYERGFRGVDFGGRIHVEYYRTADHLFSALEHQRRVDEAVVSWATKLDQQRRASNADRRTTAPVETGPARVTVHTTAGVR